MLISLRAEHIRHVISFDEDGELEDIVGMPEAEERGAAILRHFQGAEVSHQGALLLAAAHSDLGLVQKADAEFRRCLEREPNDPATHLLYALHAIQFEERRDEAISHFEQAMELDQSNAAIPFIYGYALWTVGSDPFRTRALYERCLELDDKFVDAHNELGLLLWDVLARPEDAECHFRRSIEIAPDDPHYLRVYAAYLWEHKEDEEAAKKCYEQALKIDPNDAQTHFDYARLLASYLADPDEDDPCSYAADQLRDQAMAHMERAIELEPGFSDPYFGLAKMNLIRWQDTELAKKELMKGLRLVSVHDIPEGSLDQLADRTMVDWLHEEAERLVYDPGAVRILCETALGISPDDVKMLSTLGLVLWQQGDSDGSRAIVERGLALQPDHAHLNYLYGLNLAHGLKDHEGGAEYYRKAMELDPEYWAYPHAMANLLLEAGGELKEVEAFFKRGVKADPEEPLAHIGYGKFLMDRRGDLAGAKREAEVALDLVDMYSPYEESEALYLLARVEMETGGDMEAAMDNLEEVIELDPYFLEARLDYASLLIEVREDREGAREQLEKALELDAGNEQTREVLDELIRNRSSMNGDDGV